MAGAVIENLSNRKLLIIGVGLVLMEIIITLVGGLYAPRPTQAMGPITMTACEAPRNNPQMVIPSACQEAHLEPSEKSSLDPENVVFAGLIHVDEKLHLIPWFQYLLCYANIRIEFQVENTVEDSFITMEFRLGYTKEKDGKVARDPKVWTEFAPATLEKRPLECLFDYNQTEEYEGHEYNCDPIFIFQLGSIPHPRYLVNLRIPTTIKDINQRIGKIMAIEIVGITQTGGFTQVWLALKTFLFFVMIFPCIWFWRRIRLLARKPLLIEKACFGLGISLVFVNLPLEFFTIIFDASWMLLFTDIRQGYFYAVLFSFWVVFTGEHLMDQAHRNKLSAYKCHLTCIIVTSLALLAFDLAERGVQLMNNPFATVWSHPAFGYSLIILGGVSGILYFILLAYLVYKVFRSIRYKRRFILQDERAARFQHTVGRLKAMMLLSLLTAGLTIAFFFLEQKLDAVVNEFFDVKIEVASAFFFAVYGLWNIYVCLVLSMYAPSHKQYVVADVGEEQSDEHEMTALNQNTEVTEMLQATQHEKERED